MAQIALAPQVRDDVESIFEFIARHAPDKATARIEAIAQAIDILRTSPLIGRPVEGGKREIVISSGPAGYLALYRFAPDLDIAFVLALRSQREAGYR